jgi:hypothetical protein
VLRYAVMAGEQAAALGAHREAAAQFPRGREGDAHRWLSRLQWFAGDNATAEVHARAAVELLEPLPQAGSSR